MFRLPHSMRFYGAAAIAAASLILAAPRAAHAIAAALVQVTNTAASPAIGQDVEKLVSQNIELISNPTDAYYGQPTANPIGTETFSVLHQMFPSGTYSASPFVVPAGQYLVVTSIDLYNTGSQPAAIAIQNTSNAAMREQFSVPASSSTQFQIPNGLAFPAGDSVTASNFSTSSTVIATLHGYLSSN